MKTAATACTWIRATALVAFAAAPLAAETPATGGATRRGGTTSPATLSQLSVAFEELAQRVGPAVVQIVATGYAAQAGGEGGLAKQRGTGSGVILDPEGYIVTNLHVVEGARRIQVILPASRDSGGSILKPRGRVVGAQIAGIDDETDLAVLRVEEKGLPALTLGDSEALRQGQIVLAFGSPLGLENSASLGVVSAVARQLQSDSPMIYVQTDAPINPGNSGGALVNIKGELIGINTAIASTTGGNVGVGFAIPSNMAKAAMQSLIKTGRVIRGFLGASTQDVTPLLGKLFKLPDVKGAIITDLMPKGSAEKAGLRRGDVVVRFDGKDVVEAGRLRNLIGSAPIGSKFRLEIIREGRPEQIELVIQEGPRERIRKSSSASRTFLAGHPLAGLLVDEVTPAVARQLGLEAVAGVLIAGIDEGSLAEAAGLNPGDLILEVNHQPVADLFAYQRIVEPIKAKDLTLLMINRQGMVLYVPIEGE